MRNISRLALALALGTAAQIVFAADAAPTYHIAQKLALEGDGGWDYPYVDPAAHRLYLSHADHVLVVDTESGKELGTIADTPGVHGVAIAPERGLGYISCGKANAVKVFDLKSLKVVATITTGEGPDAILYEPLSQHVLTFNGHGKSISVIDTDKNAVIDTVAVGGKPEFAHTDGLGHVYFNVEDRSELDVLDAVADKISKRWPLTPCEEPSGLAMDAKHRRLFPVCSNHLMAVVDADSGKVITTLPIGEGADGADFDPSLGRVFSANGDGTLTIARELNADHYQVEATLPTQRGARTITLDPQSHKIYLPTAKFGEPAAGASHKHPPIIPGTFTVLVVAPDTAD